MADSKTFNRQGRRVLYVLPVPRFFSQFDGVGGHIAHFHGIAQGLVQTGYTLDLLCEEAPLSFAEAGCIPHVLAAGSLIDVGRLRWGWHLQREAGRLVDQYHPDFVYVRYSTRFAPFITLLKARLPQTPLILEVNSVAAQRHAWLRWIEKGALLAADVIICVSCVMRERLAQLFGPQIRDRILVLSNAVDVRRFEQAKPALLDGYESGVRIGYAGILKPDYGLEILLHAFVQVHRQRPQVTLHVFGDGPHRPVLEEQATMCAGVHFHGAQPFEVMPDILKTLDLFVYTISNKMAFGSSTKLYEYMASGKPVIAARSPHVIQVLGDDERGMTYPIGDAETLARQMIYLIDHPDQANTLALRALHEVRTRHTWQQRVSDLLRHLAERGYVHL